MNDDTGPVHNAGWVKMMRTNDIFEMIAESPLAFTLAAMIALRARYLPGRSLKGLERGEAYLGDYRACGMSEQQYRTAKARLAEWGFATFRSTNKGTIAKLIDTRLFDVLNAPSNGQTNGQATNGQRLSKKVRRKEGKKTLRTGDFPNRRVFSKPESVEAVYKFATQHRTKLCLTGEDWEAELRQLAHRFIRYNNSLGWRVRSWRSALLGFNEVCADTGASDVPPTWLPRIE